MPSCQLIDRPEQTPAWIQIDSIQLVDNPNANEGSLSENITDGWVFINEEMVGIFELPATIPILDEGQRRLLVGPGIKVSTISTLRDNYLFFEGHEQDVDLVPGETLRIEPITRYRDPAGAYEYRLIDDFEDGLLNVETTEASDAQIFRTTNPDYVFEGSGSGLLEINDTVNAVAIRTEDMQLPQRGKAVFLEMDYYTDYPLVVGLYVNNGQLRDQNIDYLTLNPLEEEGIRFRKAYVSLTSTLAQAVNPQTVYIYLAPDIGANGGADGKVILDNLKVMIEL
jgi:hypothetical protein